MAAVPRDLVDKLAHPIPEIRWRALRALRLKIDSKFIDLVTSCLAENAFLPTLLNFLDSFDFSNLNDESETALSDLLCTLQLLSMNDSSANALIEIGALPFLRKFRPDVPLALQSMFDSIVESLLATPLNLPNLTPAEFIVPKVKIGLTVPNQREPQPRQITRSPSPHRRSSPNKHPIEAYYPAPPYLPNAVPSYPILNLGPLEEELLEEFYRVWIDGYTATKGPVSNEVFIMVEDLWNIICGDIGAQAILQKSRIFRVLLNSLEDPNSDKFSQALSMLSVVIKWWSMLFREAISPVIQDDPQLSSSASLPESSSSKSSTPLVPTDLKISLESDYSISLPFAAHSLFVALTPALRTYSFNSILKLLYSILPFLAIHVESVLRFGAENAQCVLYYICFVKEILGYYEEMTTEDSTELAERERRREETARFGCAVLVACGGLIGDDRQLSTYMSGVGMLLEAESSLVTHITSLVYHQEQRGCDFILHKLFTHPQLNVRKSVAVCISRLMELHATPPPALTHTPANILALFNQLIDPAPAQHAAYDVLLNVIDYIPAELKRTVHMWAAAFYELDDGQLANLCMEDGNDNTLFHIRGLFSKNETFQRESLDRLSLIFSKQDNYDSLAILAPFSTYQETSSEASQASASDIDMATGQFLTSSNFDAIESSIKKLALTSNGHSIPKDHEVFVKICDLIRSGEFLQEGCVLLRRLIDKDCARSSKILNSPKMMQLLLEDLPRASPALVSLLFELSFCEEGQSGTLTRLPQFVIDNFYVHMAVVELKLDSIVVGISDEESKLLWNIVLDFVRNDSLLSSKPAAVRPRFNLLMNLKSAGSHEDFLMHLESLYELCINDDDYSVLLECHIEQVFDRFLTIPPASEKDLVVFDRILAFSVDFFTRPLLLREGFSRVCFKATQNVLLPMVGKYVEHLDQGTSLSSAPDLLYLSIVNFLRHSLSQQSDQALRNLCSSTNIFDTLQSFLRYAFLAFSAEESADNSLYSLCVDSLLILLHLISRGSILATMDTGLVHSLAFLLVDIIYYCQKEIGIVFEASHGKATCFRGIRIFRYTCILLRTLMAHPQDAFEIAGVLNRKDKDWLWLRSMLQYENTHLSNTMAWSIFGWILSTPDGEILATKIFPVWKSACFDAIVAGYARKTLAPPEKALEAINNYLLSGYKHLPSPEFKELVSRVLVELEDRDFWAKAEELAKYHDGAISYLTNLAKLVFNLAVFDTKSMLNNFQKNESLFRCFCDNLLGKQEALDEILPGQGWQTVAWNQFLATDEENLSTMRCHILRTFILFALHDSEWARIRALDVLPPLCTIFAEFSSFYRMYSDLNKMHRMHLTIIGLSIRCTALYIPTSEDQSLNINLENLFSKDGSNLHIIRLIFISLLQREDTTIQWHAISLLCKLTSLHYGQVVDLSLNSIIDEFVAFEEDESSGGVGQYVMGIALFSQLSGMLYEYLDSEEISQREAVLTAMQALLGRSLQVKEYFMKDRHLDNVVEAIAESMKSKSGKIIFSSADRVVALLKLLRHFFAGYENAKTFGLRKGLQFILSDIIGSRDTPMSVMQEALQCLRNMVGNCPEVKCALGEELRQRLPSAVTPTVLDSILSSIQHPAANTNVVSQAVELLKAVASNVEGRTGLIKGGVGQALHQQMLQHIKLKETAKIGILLQFFCALSSYKDGQIHVIRINGLFSELLSSALSKSHQVSYLALTTLCNLASLRENKPFFLSDDEFLPTILRVLQGRALRNIACATTLIWVILYDFQKAKFLFKKPESADCLRKLERRLNTEYPRVEEMDDEDIQYLLAVFSSIGNILDLLGERTIAR